MKSASRIELLSRAHSIHCSPNFKFSILFLAAFNEFVIITYYCARNFAFLVKTCYQWVMVSETTWPYVGFSPESAILFKLSYSRILSEMFVIFTGESKLQLDVLEYKKKTIKFHPFTNKNNFIYPVRILE